jgi:hypothetical protein
MKFNVLVFPCGSEIGLEIYKALSANKHISLYGASSVKSNHGKYVYKNYIEGLPDISEPDIIDKLNSIVEKYNIDCIFPAHDSVVTKLSEMQSDIICKVITSPKETCRVARSKLATYQLLKGVVPTPRVYTSDEDIEEFPVFLKPDVGQGSRGTVKCSTLEEVRFHLSKDKSLLILEFLPGKEYTVDCFTDFNRDLRFVGPRERVRIQNGISVNTVPVKDTRFEEMAKKINDMLVFQGAWFFQVKENARGELVLMEIAPRIAGAMALNRNRGINLPLLSIYDAFKVKVDIILSDFSLEMDRALTNRFITNLSYEHVYIDLDDTIILNGNINTQLIAFLYQCINRKIKVHLVTRYSGNLSQILQEYRISQLFDSCFQLTEREKKSSCIRFSNSIFIDDSFKERKEVFENLGIPVFDCDSVELLIN